MAERVDPSDSYILSVVSHLAGSLAMRLSATLRSLRAIGKESACIQAIRRIQESLPRLLSGSFAWKAATRVAGLVAVSEMRPGPEALFGVALGLAFLHSSEVAISVTLLAVVWRIVLATTPRRVPDPSEQPEGRRCPASLAGWMHPSLFLPLYALMMFATGSALSSVTPAYSLRNLVMWVFYMTSFAMGLDASRRGKERHVALPLLLAATVSSCCGIYQYLTGFRSYEGWLDTEFEDLTRITGTFGNPSFFSQALALAIPVGAAFVLSSRGVRRRVVAALYVMVQGAALLLTLGRAAWIGCLFSLLVVAAFYDRRLVVLGLVVLLVALPFLPEYVVKRFVSAFSTEDSSNSYRISVWRGSLALARAHLVTGTGLGAESFVYTYPDYMVIGTTAWHSHCVYLQILIEMGIFGLGSFLWLLSVWGLYAWKGIFRSYAGLFAGGKGTPSSFSGGGIPVGAGPRKGEAAVALAAAAGVLGSLAQGLVEHTLYSPRVALIFWTWAGLSAGLSLRSRCDTGDVNDPEEEGRDTGAPERDRGVPGSMGVTQ